MSKITEQLRGFVLQTESLCNKMQEGTFGDATPEEVDVVLGLRRCVGRLMEDIKNLEYVPPPVDDTVLSNEEEELIQYAVELLQDQMQYDTYISYDKVKCDKEHVKFMLDANFGNLIEFSVPVIIDRKIVARLSEDREAEEVMDYIEEALRQYIMNGGKYEV